MIPSRMVLLESRKHTATARPVKGRQHKTEKIV